MHYIKRYAQANKLPGVPDRPASSAAAPNIDQLRTGVIIEAVSTLDSSVFLLSGSGASLWAKCTLSSWLSPIPLLNGSDGSGVVLIKGGNLITHIKPPFSWSFEASKRKKDL